MIFAFAHNVDRNHCNFGSWNKIEYLYLNITHPIIMENGLMVVDLLWIIPKDTYIFKCPHGRAEWPTDWTACFCDTAWICYKHLQRGENQIILKPPLPSIMGLSTHIAELDSYLPANSVTPEEQQSYSKPLQSRNMISLDILQGVQWLICLKVTKNIQTFFFASGLWAHNLNFAKHVLGPVNDYQHQHHHRHQHLLVLL